MSTPMRTGEWKRSAQAQDHLLVLKLRGLAEWRQLTADHARVSAELAAITEDWAAGQEKNSPQDDLGYVETSTPLHQRLARLSHQLAELINRWGVLCRLCWDARAVGTRSWEGSRTRACRRCMQIREPGQGDR